MMSREEYEYFKRKTDETRQEYLQLKNKKEDIEWEIKQKTRELENLNNKIRGTDKDLEELNYRTRKAEEDFKKINNQIIQQEIENNLYNIDRESFMDNNEKNFIADEDDKLLNLKLGDLAKELQIEIKDIYDFTSKKKLVVIAEYFRRFYGDERIVSATQKEKELHVDKEILNLMNTLSDDQKEEANARYFNEFYIENSDEVEQYKNRLVDLLHFECLTPVLKKFVISCFMNDVHRIGNGRFDFYKLEVLILTMLVTMPENMQLAIYKKLRNSEIKYGNAYFVNNFKNIDPVVSDKIHMLQRSLSPEEIFKGIELGEDDYEKLKFASIWVTEILDPNQNINLMSLICKKYRDLDTLKNILENLGGNYLGFKLTFRHFLELFSFDYNIDDDWQNQFIFLKKLIDLFQDEDLEKEYAELEVMINNLELNKARR